MNIIYWKCFKNEIVVDLEKTNKENHDALSIEDEEYLNSVWKTDTKDTKGMLIHMLRKSWVNKDSYIDAFCELYKFVDRITITYYNKSDINLIPHSHKSISDFKKFANTEAIYEFYRSIE